MVATPHLRSGEATEPAHLYNIKCGIWNCEFYVVVAPEQITWMRIRECECVSCAGAGMSSRGTKSAEIVVPKDDERTHSFVPPTTTGRFAHIGYKLAALEHTHTQTKCGRSCFECVRVCVGVYGYSRRSNARAHRLHEINNIFSRF